MPQFDSHNNILQAVALNPATIATDTTTDGNIIDTLGFQSVEFIVYCGTRTDGTYTPLIKDGADSGLSDAAAVDDAYLLGTEAAAALSASNTAKRIGYKGNKRYVRLSIVSTSTTSGCTSVGAIAILGHPEVQATAAS